MTVPVPAAAAHLAAVPLLPLPSFSSAYGVSASACCGASLAGAVSK